MPFLKKPCGDTHPLPCGLDKSCDVPPCYYNAARSSEAAWELYQENQDHDQNPEEVYD